MATKDISDLQVCEAVRDAFNNGHTPWSYELLVQRTGQPEKVCYRALKRAEGRGYIEYGVSLRTGWLTSKAEKLLSENGKEKW